MLAWHNCADGLIDVTRSTERRVFHINGTETYYTKEVDVYKGTAIVFVPSSAFAKKYASKNSLDFIDRLHPSPNNFSSLDGCIPTLLAALVLAIWMAQ